jgi:hypothetical protein
MSLILPSVSSTIGPLWATELNTALTLVDSHDHSSGKGVKVTPSGLNINADLSMVSHNLTLVRTVALDSQAAALSSADIRSVYSVLGDLYWNNGSGTAVQITSGTSVQSSTSTIARAFERVAVNANKTILAGDTYSFLDTDTGSSIIYTLPAANAVAAGRFYEFKDSTGTAGTNNITINRAGADTIDGATSAVIRINYGSTRLTSDGLSKWMLGTLPEAQLLKNLTSVKNITNWGATAWTPTGSWSTNTTYTGSYRRVGDTGQFRVRIVLSGVPDNVNLTVNLPASHTIDTTKTLGTNNGIPLGNCVIKDAAPGPGFLWNPVVYSTTTAVEIDGTTVSGSYATFSIVSRIYPFTFAVNDTIDIYFEAPIVEYA